MPVREARPEADVTWDEDEKAGHEWDFWDVQIEKVLEWLP